MKVTALFLTTLISLGIGVAWFFMLILSLNGFTGKQSEPGLILFIVWAVVSAIIAGVLGYFGAGYLIDKKAQNPVFAAFAAIVVFVIVGSISDFVGFLGAVALTSAQR